MLNSNQAHLVADTTSKQSNAKWLLITLNTQTCSGEQLPGAIDDMLQAFRRLTNRKTFKDNTTGYFRATEITPNPKSPKSLEYNPKLHVLLAVRPSYFGRGFIKQKDWVQHWQDALKADYVPVVDIRRLKEGPDEAINEIFERSLEPADYLIKNNKKKTDEIVQALDNAIDGRRFLGFGGSLKEAWNQLRKNGTIEDLED